MTKLTYRGVSYNRENPMTIWMLQEKLKRQREEFEAKLDKARMQEDKVAIV